jgi:hypothetical protein
MWCLKFSCDSIKKAYAYNALARLFHIYKTFFFMINTLYFLSNGVFSRTNIIKLRIKHPELPPRNFLHLTPNDTTKEMEVLFVREHTVDLYAIT